MAYRILFPGFCASAIVLLNAGTATAQQPKPLPAKPVIADPIDPASLNAPPAFGDSAPVKNQPVETSTQKLPLPETSALAETEWKPKLKVVLLTKAGTLGDPVPYHRLEESKPFTSDLNVPLPNAGNRTANRTNLPEPSLVILTCDEVTLDAKATETGELAYSVSCKGKVMLRIDDYTVTGDSISSDNGKLTITNAVVKSDKATLSAEKMQIQLPIFGVRVEPGSAEPKGSIDSLDPVPDAIDRSVFPPSARLETY